VLYGIDFEEDEDVDMAMSEKTNIHSWQTAVEAPREVGET